MALKQYQEQFKTHILNDPDALYHADATFASNFKVMDTKDLGDRLSVYRNNVVSSLIEALTKSFPLVHALVGDDFMKAMARGYMLTNPPAQGCLHEYGLDFDDFIRSFKPAESLPYLPDVAALEIASNTSYHAKDDPPLTSESLAQIAPEALGTLNLTLRNACVLLESDYPLLDIERMCLEPDSAEQLDLNKGGVKILVYRPQFETLLAPLADDEYTLLKGLNEGEALGTAVEAVLNNHPDFDFQAFLQKHLALETFQALTPNR